ncbi:MAG TPA: PLP-dependent aspartate aminotransferase family protein [Oculatellaceae cyanobacterium]
MSTDCTNSSDCQSSENTDTTDCNAISKLGFNTLAIHYGQEEDPTTGALITPIYQTSTYVLEELGKNKGYKYARTHNPTRTALEKCIAALEGTEYGIATASGMAAATCVLNLLAAGDHVIAGDDIYGGVYRLFEHVFKKFNVEFTYVDASDPANIEKAIKPNTKLVWLESPTNPLLKLADLKAVGEITKKHNILFAVDNTFATPFTQKPLALGADLVIHSTTKYLSGHSDCIGGCIVTASEKLNADLQFIVNSTGLVPGPFDCFLILRGIKTLSLRLREHEKNAKAIATFLESHPLVERVYYPGLPSHPQFSLAKSQMAAFGGVLSFVVKGGLENARGVVNSTKLFKLAESLGGVKSLICHPVSQTHAPIPKEIRDRVGIVDGLIRVSVGLEDEVDLLADLQQALEKVAATQSKTVERAKVEA